jgi:acid phosphatase
MEAAPAEQTGKFGKLPPAVVLDVDETLLDNSAYQAWNVRRPPISIRRPGPPSSAPKSSRRSGGAGVRAYAAAKGVTVFYVTNRSKEEEPATRENLRCTSFR